MPHRTLGLACTLLVALSGCALADAADAHGDRVIADNSSAPGLDWDRRRRTATLGVLGTRAPGLLLHFVAAKPESRVVKTIARCRLDNRGTATDARDVTISFGGPLRQWSVTGADLGWSGQGLFVGEVLSDDNNGPISSSERWATSNLTDAINHGAALECSIAVVIDEPR